MHKVIIFSNLVGFLEKHSEKYIIQTGGEGHSKLLKFPIQFMLLLLFFKSIHPLSHVNSKIQLANNWPHCGIFCLLISLTITHHSFLDINNKPVIEKNENMKHESANQTDTRRYVFKLKCHNFNCTFEKKAFYFLCIPTKPYQSLPACKNFLIYKS